MADNPDCANFAIFILDLRTTNLKIVVYDFMSFGYKKKIQ